MLKVQNILPVDIVHEESELISNRAIRGASPVSDGIFSYVYYSRQIQS